MPSSEAHLPLDYTSQWVALGIVSSADILGDEQESLVSDDPHSEHHRWRAFSRFLAAQPRLSSALAQQLYSLRATDADHTMGGSIMAAILRHTDCPAELLHSALESQHSHLHRIAAQRLNRNDRNT